MKPPSFFFRGYPVCQPAAQSAPGQIDQIIEVGKGKALEDSFGLIGWLIPTLVDLAIQLTNPFLRERMKPVYGSKFCECALILIEQ